MLSPTLVDAALCHFRELIRGTSTSSRLETGAIMLQLLHQLRMPKADCRAPVLYYGQPDGS